MEYVVFRDNMQFTDPHFLAQCSPDSFRSVLLNDHRSSSHIYYTVMVHSSGKVRFLRNYAVDSLGIHLLWSDAR